MDTIVLCVFVYFDGDKGPDQTVGIPDLAHRLQFENPYVNKI